MQHEAAALDQVGPGLRGGARDDRAAPTDDAPVVQDQGVDGTEGLDGVRGVNGNPVRGPGLVDAGPLGGQQGILEPVGEDPAGGLPVGGAHAPGRHGAVGVVGADLAGEGLQLGPGVGHLVAGLGEGVRRVPHEGLQRDHERGAVGHGGVDADLDPVPVPAGLHVAVDLIGQRVDDAGVDELGHHGGLGHDGQVRQVLRVVLARRRGPRAGGQVGSRTVEQLGAQLGGAGVLDVDARAALELGHGGLEALGLGAGQAAGDGDGGALVALIGLVGGAAGGRRRARPTG